MIQTQLILVLAADSDVTDIIGSRVYPMRMPQKGSLPAVVYQKINADPINSLDGDSGLDRISMQLTCWAKTYAVATQLSALVRNAIIASGSLKALTENEIDTEDPDTKHYGVVIDFSMWSTFSPSVTSTLASFLRVTYAGDGVTDYVQLAQPIAENGFYLVTQNGLILKEGTQYTINATRDRIIFTTPPEGGSYPDEGLVIYQPAADGTEVRANFDRVEFEGDGVTTEVPLNTSIVDNGFYLVMVNGRIAKEGAGATYTLNALRDKVIFNSPPAGGSFKDEILIIYQTI